MYTNAYRALFFFLEGNNISLRAHVFSNHSNCKEFLRIVYLKLRAHKKRSSLYGDMEKYMAQFIKSSNPVLFFLPLTLEDFSTTLFFLSPQLGAIMTTLVVFKVQNVTRNTPTTYNSNFKARRRVASWIILTMSLHISQNHDKDPQNALLTPYIRTIRTGSSSGPLSGPEENQGNNKSHLVEP